MKIFDDDNSTNVEAEQEQVRSTARSGEARGTRPILSSLGRMESHNLEHQAGNPERTKLIECKGKRYIDFILLTTELLGSDSYFEIGTRTGGSLSRVACKSVAVDPNFVLKSDVIGNKEICMFFQIPSDKFFREHDLTKLLGGPFAVAFLDGFHVYEYLLRDFMNTEKHGRRNSIVFMHDCLPALPEMAFRKPLRGAERRGGWAGDVWKVVPILKRYRPDLKIHALDCPPTGLIMITNLNPASQVLEEKYFDIISEYAESGEDMQKLSEFLNGVSLVQTSTINDLTDLAQYLWA